MQLFTFFIISAVLEQSSAQIFYESDINFRIEAGTQTCFFEKAKAGQTMEVYYEVLDGQHGDLDIIFQVIDPSGVKILDDYKKSRNSVIIDLVTDGDYAFCMDNTYSLMNSKLVFAYVMVEDKSKDMDVEGRAVSEDGEVQVEGILEWEGTDDVGVLYYLEVRDIADSLSRTLQNVLRARHLLELYGVTKSRDSYLAFEDTFFVDMWSAFQITFMVIVGTLQVYIIKKLFKS